jgi:hypothetical protein
LKRWLITRIEKIKTQLIQVKSKNSGAIKNKQSFLSFFFVIFFIVGEKVFVAHVSKTHLVECLIDPVDQTLGVVV